LVVGAVVADVVDVAVSFAGPSCIWKGAVVVAAVGQLPGSTGGPVALMALRAKLAAVASRLSATNMSMTDRLIQDRNVRSAAKNVLGCACARSHKQPHTSAVRVQLERDEALIASAV
jgi:hypothetical protein